MKIEESMTLPAQTMTYGGAGTTVASGLSFNEWGVVIGAVVGLVGLAFQVWLGMRREKRERELHRMKMNGR